MACHGRKPVPLYYYLVLCKRYLEIFDTPTHLSKSNQEPSLRPTNPDERLPASLAATLNPWVELGVGALAQARLPSSGRWYDNLHIVQYGKAGATTDGVGVATTLKPDLAAGNDLKGLESETENLS
ncbi:hypothetical protein B0H10DRAFT_2224027 [Mycena sp. CBHHK59/15]|nr:hypothetical protein B0H10DRAFT_2224027 [Mycena sp. CBHHK59/15]